MPLQLDTAVLLQEGMQKLLFNINQAIFVHKPHRIIWALLAYIKVVNNMEAALITINSSSSNSLRF